MLFMFDWTVKLHHTNNVKGRLKNTKNLIINTFLLYISNIQSATSMPHIRCYLSGNATELTSFKLDTAYNTWAMV